MRLTRGQESWGFNHPSPTQMAYKVEAACIEGLAKKKVYDPFHSAHAEWSHYSGRCEFLSPTSPLMQQCTGSAQAGRGLKNWQAEGYAWGKWR